MNVTLIIGTAQKGCTYTIAGRFREILEKRTDCQFRVFTLPTDMPHFCTGCKTCFQQKLDRCPHGAQTLPIWQAMEASDLIVFALPVYVFGVPGQVKALLDHYASCWMAHRPREAMFEKQALIITQAIGMGTGKAARTLRNSLLFWGVSRIRTVKVRMMEADYGRVSQKIKDKLDRDLIRAIRGFLARRGGIRPKLKTRLIFWGMRLAQRRIAKDQARQGRPETFDHKYWREKGWLESARPWKKA